MDGITPQRDSVSEMASRGFGNQADVDFRYTRGTSDNPETNKRKFIPVSEIAGDTDIADIDSAIQHGEIDHHATIVDDARTVSRQHTVDHSGKHPNFNGQTYVDDDVVPDELVGREELSAAQSGGADVKGSLAKRDAHNPGKTERHLDRLAAGDIAQQKRKNRNVGNKNMW